MKRLLFSVLIALFVLSAIVTAQTTVTGELSGTVTDPTGATVPNAKVTLKNDATGETQSATTGNNGDFRFSLLRPGSYTFVVSSPGFQDSQQTVTISLGQIANVKVQLGSRQEYRS
jgi:hypothetical protein